MRHFDGFSIRLFLYRHLFNTLTVVFAIAGMIGAFKHITWLMIAGTVLAFLLHPVGYEISDVDENWRDIPYILTSNILVLVMSVIGALLGRVFLKLNLWICLAISMNGSILVLFALSICYVMYRKLSRDRMRKEYEQKMYSLINEDDD